MLQGWWKSKNCKGKMLVPGGNSTVQFCSIPAELEYAVFSISALNEAVLTHCKVEGRIRLKHKDRKLLIEGEAHESDEKGMDRLPH